MRRHYRVTLALPSILLAAGCATQPEFPPGIDGYQCSRSEITPAGQVGASAMPDYRGGFRTFSMQWESRPLGDDSLAAHAYWSEGRDAIAPPVWLSISRVTLERVPPQHTKFRLRLSTGEVRDEEFALPREWRKIQGPFRFGASVLVRDPVFIERFTQAAWLDVSVMDPAGQILAQRRLDLAGVPDAMALMRRLGDEVTADLADYQNRCLAIPHEDLEEIVLTMHPAG
jgi:hypothetical protein